MPRRKKLSTTIGPENYAYLRQLVEAGQASSLGEAVDRALKQVRRAENRARLARDTAAYFDRLRPKAAEEEAWLESALDQTAEELDLGGG